MLIGKAALCQATDEYHRKQAPTVAAGDLMQHPQRTMDWRYSCTSGGGSER